MASKDEIRMGSIAVRYLVEGHEANNTVAMFEFDVAPGSKVPGPHSHDGYEETAYGLEGITGNTELISNSVVDFRPYYVSRTRWAGITAFIRSLRWPSQNLANWLKPGAWATTGDRFGTLFRQNKLQLMLRPPLSIAI